VQANNPGYLALIKLAMDGIAHLPVQALKIICFGEDGFTRCPGDIAALGRLLRQK
jgi:hypothetical protein